MVEASQQVQSDIKSNRTLTYLHGCHLFLRIFVLDNLDLGIFNLPHDILPRICCFDNNKLRRMILRCTNPNKGTWDYSIAPICYTRSTWDTPPYINIQKECLFRRRNCMWGHRPTQHHHGLSRDKFQHQHRPLEWSLLVILKTTTHIFIRTLPCILPNNPNHSSAASPSTSYIFPTRLDMNQFEGTSPCSSTTRKATSSRIDFGLATNKKIRYHSGQASPSGLYHPRNLTTPVQPIIPSKLTFIEQAKSWADTIVGGILLLNDDDNLPADAVVFGQLSANNPTKSDCKHTQYGSNHWLLERSLASPSPHTLLSLQTAMSQLNRETLSKNWFIHVVPRYLSIAGDKNYEQLLGDSVMDHELCSLIIRRFLQIDRHILYINLPVWRHFLVPVFSTITLAGQTPWDMKCVQNKFYGQAVYNLANCRLFIIPAILQNGWCSYVWDMERKVIHVLDPLACSLGYNEMKILHEPVADKLHVALFTCLFKYFTNRHTNCIDWVKKYETITYENFFRSESGPAMLHMIRNFDAFGIKEFLNKDTMKLQKLRIVAELIKH